MNIFFRKILNSFTLKTIFDWVEKRLLAKGLKYWDHSFPAYKLNRKNNHPENMCDIFFLKSKRSWWDSKQRECLCWSSCPKGSLNQILWAILQNLQENIYTGIFIFVFSCEYCKFCKSNIFAEQHWILLLIIAVSIVPKGVLTSETVKYDRKTKTYVLIWARNVSCKKGSPGKRRAFKGSSSRCSNENFVNFTGQHLCWSFRSAALLKRDFNTGVFLWNLQNF